ncbi:MAG: hypothetical protein M1821_003515 [Bathelium mastoideum]|nr:MAG: hypothetical protein M1821_003515 [Bathelium mastoideum]
MIIRGAVCVIYYGVQTSLGGNAVQAMIEAIWPSFKGWHINALPASSVITAPGILSFTIFWLFSIPLLWLSIPALRWVFIVKVVLMPFFWVALFTWGITAAHGWGPLFSIPSTVKQTSGWTLGYAFCYTITASIGANATFAVNIPDITRYAHNRKHAWQTQIIALPVVITLTELLGTVLAASSQIIYGSVQWNPLALILLWDNRAAKFFAGLLFAFAHIATNVSGNSVPFANDLTGLFPAYINIRRGQVICAILAFAICPWLIEAKAARFLAFLNGYSIFLGPLVGILMTDYFIVRRGRGFNVFKLYQPHNDLYWYTAGVNPRAIAALVIGIVPLIPGLINQINPAATAGIGRGILNFYSMAWLDGVVLAGLSYWLLFLAFPFPVGDADQGRRYLEEHSGRRPQQDEELVGVHDSPASGSRSGASADEKMGVTRETNAL